MTDSSRMNELNAALSEKVAQNQEIADAVEVVDGTMQIDAAHRDVFQANMAEIKQIKGLLDDLNVMGEATAASVAAEFAAKGAGEAVSAAEYSSIGDAFVNSHEFKSLNAGSNGLTMPTAFEVKDVYSGLPSGTPAAFGSIQREDIVGQAKRTSRVRDLFPVRRTNAAVIEYFRQTGFTNNAATVAEYDTGAAAGEKFPQKPQSSMAFVGEQAPVRTIAHWEAAHRNVLADEPQLRSIIDNELLYGLRLEEDDQILNGSGTGEDLTGILNVSGIQTYAWSSGPSTAPVADTKADAIRRAMTLAFLAYYEPTGVVVHPSDFEDMELTKDSNGQYLMAVNIQQGAQARVWNVPVIDTPAIAEGTALVGAFGTGAQLYDRDEASIRVAEQHSDFFVRNAVVVLAEQRLALACKRPESFVKVSFDAAPTVA